MYAVEAVLSLSQFKLVLRHGSVPLRPGSPVRSGRPPGRCQTGSDCTAPTSPPGPRYTPDELGLEDPDADEAPDAPPPSGREAGETPEGVEGDSGPGAHADRTEAALEGGYSAATVVELCRFYYDQPTLAEPATIRRSTWPAGWASRAYRASTMSVSRAHGGQGHDHVRPPPGAGGGRHLAHVPRRRRRCGGTGGVTPPRGSDAQMRDRAGPL